MPLKRTVYNFEVNISDMPDEQSDPVKVSVCPASSSSNNNNDQTSTTNTDEEKPKSPKLPGSMPAVELSDNHGWAFVEEVHPDKVAETGSETSGENPLKKKERLVAEAKSARHLMTHFPRNPECLICTQGSAQRRRKRKGTLNLGPRPEKFGSRSLRTTSFNVQKSTLPKGWSRKKR